MSLGLDEGYAALTGAVAGRVVARDVVLAAGPDALSYLQGQCSQDLEGMAPGEYRRSLLLTPQGKIVALVRVVALAPDRYAVEVDHGFGDAVHDRLRRFKLRVKVELETVAWRCAELRGPQAASAAGAAAAAGGGSGAGGGELATLALRLDDRFGHGIDLLGPAAELPVGVPVAGDDAFEALRVEAGVPAMGSELDESTIPQSAGIVEATVSFTKGCYTGQELVARLDARGGKVPQVLRGVVFPGAGRSEVPERGAELVGVERVVGSLTSVAWSPRLEAPVALCYVRREVQPPAPVSVAPAAGSGAPLAGEVRQLPLV